MQNRVVIITGSSRGIGLALAEGCAARGDRVVVHGRDAARVAEAIAQIRAAVGDSGELVGITADLATVAGAEQLVRESLAAFGRIDVLVNNAATTASRAPLWEIEPHELASVIATNVIAPMACARAVLAWAVLRDEPVRIVNVSSGISTRPRADAAAYAASKAALDAFTHGLARDLATSRATVTGIALAGHRTELARRALPADEYAALPEASAAVRRLLTVIGAPAEDVHGRIIAGGDGPPIDIDGADLIEHPLGASPRARAALAAVATEGSLERYPEASPLALRKVLAARFGAALDAIVLGAGASELLDRVVRVALQPGETIVANSPSWPGLAHACRAHRLAWKQVPYRLVDGRADHDLDAVLAAVDRSTRLVYLTSPANPGGAAIDRAAFLAFVAALPRHVTIVVDEAYAEYVQRPDALEAAALVRASDRPFVVLRTFSKFYGLAGLRIGFAIATDPLARQLAAAAPAFPLARGAAEAAIAALGDLEHAAKTRAAIATGRARLIAELDARGIAHLTSDAPFLLAAVPESFEVHGPRYFDRRYVMLSVAKEIPWPNVDASTTR